MGSCTAGWREAEGWTFHHSPGGLTSRLERCWARGTSEGSDCDPEGPACGSERATDRERVRVAAGASLRAEARSDCLPLAEAGLPRVPAGGAAGRRRRRGSGEGERCGEGLLCGEWTGDSTGSGLGSGLPAGGWGAAGAAGCAGGTAGSGCTAGPSPPTRGCWAAGESTE